MTRTTRRVDYLPLDEVVPALRNPKRHDTAAIAASIAKFGVGELPLVDERTGRLVAGHGRIDQLAEMCAAGQDPPDGVSVDAEGRWLVPVTRGWSSRSDAEAEAYLLASNKLTVNGGWDDVELADLLQSLGEIDPELVSLAGYADEDLAAVLAHATDRPAAAGLTDPDDVPDPPTEPASALGDLWLLGEHRLLCGDATSPESLDRVANGREPTLIYTDPPYGIDIVKQTGKVGHHTGMPFGGRKGSVGGGHVVPTTKYLPVAGDETTETAASAFRMLITRYPSARHVWWGGNHYAGSAGLPDASCWLIWDKENNGHFADAELAWTNHPGAVRLLRHMWNGMLRASERGGGQRVHPTQKPVALAEWAFGVVDLHNERRVVLDVFAGSGSTLIAAHHTDRTALLIEMEPHYVDVICRRFQEHTGVKPVLAATGTPHDFCCGGTRSTTWATGCFTVRCGGWLRAAASPRSRRCGHWASCASRCGSRTSTRPRSGQERGPGRAVGGQQRPVDLACP